MAGHNPFTRFLREVRFLSYSYNFERDHTKKHVRLLLGGSFLLAGLALTGLAFTREALTPWVTVALALFGLFLLLTADDEVLSKREIVREEIPFEMLKQARTTGRYSGFGIEDAQYLYSRSVNRLLMEQDLFATLKPRPFALDPKIRRLAPYVLGEAVTPKGKRLFNREVRLASDITEQTFSEGRKAVLQPTDYVSGVCTNDLAMTRLLRRGTREVLLDGLELVLEDRVVRSLEHSRCANLIGINSLVVLADGYYLVRQQVKPYADNFGQLVPFVSASLSLDDYVASLTLQQMVSRAISRRLCQETGYARPEQVRTALLGYARILERGGKPEFLALTVVHDTLEGFLSKEAVQKGNIRIPYPVQAGGRDLDSVVRTAVALSGEHAEECSVQLKASVHSLGLAHRDSRLKELLGRAVGLG